MMLKLAIWELAVSVSLTLFTVPVGVIWVLSVLAVTVVVVVVPVLVAALV
jgi:hypothetical protein